MNEEKIRRRTIRLSPFVDEELNEIAKKILYIENKGIKEYIGNYDDYINKSKISN